MAILEGGIKGFAFSSGQAANMAVFSLLNPGDHVILTDDIYGGTFRIVGDVFGRYGIEHTYVDMSELDQVRAAIRPNTKMLFIETPTNPMMKVADIRAVSEIAKEIGALTVVDNTFLTPYFQKPLTLGADIVTHSSTKFLGGHNDALSGIVVVKDDEEIAEKIHVHIKSHGSQLAPMDSWLVLRGIKTLAVRMDRHNANAKRVAEWLREQPKVQKVYYVGFPDHKDYDVTMKQTTGFGGMISFTVDSFETVKKILKGVDMIMFAESLGGTETLITYPTTQTHEDTPEDVKNALGITDCFLRMSVGIENVEDIIADLDRAMHA
jgi:cystathionine gamma-synthase